MCARPGQTDLMDGEDESRNAQVAALKRLFYSAEAEESVPDEESAAPSAVDDTAGKRAAAQAGLPESAAAPAAPAAKQAKRDPAVPAEEKKPKDVIEVEAPRANAA